MVRFYNQILALLLCLGVSTPLMALVKVTVDLEKDTFSTTSPVTGTITISHAKNEKIAPYSFLMEDKPLNTQLLQDVTLTPDQIASIYRFSLPPQPEGLYTLPSISLEVNAKRYNTAATTYVVRNSGTAVTSIPSSTANPTPTATPKSTQPATTSRPAIPGASTSPVVLRLEALVDGPTILYPGQKTKFVYRYFFSGNIELNQETLPLMDAEGFKKIGQQEIRDAQTDQLGVRQVVQEVQAIKAGTFVFGPSIIAGRAYQEDSQGRRTYLGTPLRAEAPAITMTVKPFPDQNKPPAFNGAIGDFTSITTVLQSPSDVVLGDAVTISVTVNGKGDFSTVSLPDLCCIPGFSGRFRASDIPPMEEVDGDSKHFVTQLKPLSISIREIPSIPFAFFNPATGTYGSLTSQPVTMNVVKDPLGITSSLPAQGEEVEWPREANATPPKPPVIAQHPEMVQRADEELQDFNWWLYFLIALAAIGLWVVLRMNRKASKPSTPSSISTQEPSSEQLLANAYQAQKDPSRFFYLLSHSLLKRLAEQGEILNANTPIEALPQSGLAGEVRSFLTRIEEQRFSGKGLPSTTQLLQEAALLHKKIQAQPKT